MLAAVLWLISFGFTIYSQGIVQSAAREAARHAAIYGIDDPGVYAEANKVLALVIPDNPDFVLNGETLSLSREGNMVSAVITYYYKPFVDFKAISGIIGSEGTNINILSGAAYFRNEKPDT